MPTVTDFTKAYGVQPNTIRQWASHFSDFLSPGANPPKGQRRQFNYDDAEVIALIADMRTRYESYESIRAALAAGDLGQWPPEGHQKPQDDAGEAQQGQQAPLALITQLTAKASSLEGELKATKEELDRRMGELKEAQVAARDAEKRATVAETKLEALSILGDEETPSGGQGWRQRLARWISGEES